MREETESVSEEHAEGRGGQRDQARCREGHSAQAELGTGDLWPHGLA